MNGYLLEELESLSSSLSEATAAFLAANATICVNVVAASADAGKSRFGGAFPIALLEAHDPAEFRHLRMLADIFLSEVPATGMLPSEGRLIILADEGDNREVETFCTILPEETSRLTVKEDDPQLYLEAVHVQFRLSLSFPIFIRLEDEVQKVSRILNHFGATESRLLGHTDPDVFEILRCSDDMMLLAQFDSFDPLEELLWWDNGRLQVVVPNQELTPGVIKGAKGVIVDFG